MCCGLRTDGGRSESRQTGRRPAIVVSLYCSSCAKKWQQKAEEQGATFVENTMNPVQIAFSLLRTNRPSQSHTFKRIQTYASTNSHQRRQTTLITKRSSALSTSTNFPSHPLQAATESITNLVESQRSLILEDLRRSIYGPCISCGGL